MKRVIVVLTAVVALLPLNLEAATIVQPTSVANRSSQANSSRAAAFTQDGSGLSFALSTGDPLPGVYPNHDNDASNMWATSPGDAAPHITYDLGSEFTLTGLHLWNFNQPSFTDVGAREISVTFSTTSATLGFGGAELIAGANQFSIAPATNTYNGEDRWFDTAQTARWVRIDILTNHGNADYNGFSEIRFFEGTVPVAAVPIPEPSTLGLLTLTLTTFLIRKRHRHGGV